MPSRPGGPVLGVGALDKGIALLLSCYPRSSGCLTAPQQSKGAQPKDCDLSIVTALTIVGTVIVASLYRGCSSVGTGRDLSDPSLNYRTITQTIANSDFSRWSK
ncbi:hypothetical protein [Pontibacter pudoricolor]|uniref:hypothetical protein n=1 Tax=Pontibacter pudoricolor TaxID=2694930 RepID=UPI001390FEB7|nr:hypothetical protein [Pontibacter pudoricolor]